MEFVHRPIVTWPGPMTPRRKRSTFRAGYTATLNLLEQELRHLGARNIVLQVALQPGDIRLDGLPRAGARPSHPGVILSFDSKHGPLSYPCDRYDRHEDNIRAIALSLQALRAVDRYGVTRRAEQYRGWAQLEAPAPEPTGMGPTEAIYVLTKHAGRQAGLENWRDVYREAVLRTHPDRGGSAVDFGRVQAARAALELESP